MTEIVVAILIACAPGPVRHEATGVTRSEASCHAFVVQQMVHMTARHGRMALVIADCIPVTIPDETRS